MPEPILASVIVVTVATFTYKIVEKIINAPKEGVKQVGDSTGKLLQTIGAELRQTFNAQPVITVNRRVIQQAPQRICEWCFAKQVVAVEEKWENKQWGSKKRLHLAQMFTLKAGFDLNRIRLEVHEAGRRVRLVITDATIVNVEYHSPYELRLEEHGWWNRISNAERDRVINTLPAKAREDASHKDLTQLATEELTVVLGNFFKKFGCDLEVACQNHDLRLKDDSSLPEIPEEKLAALGIVTESTGAL